MWGHLWWGIMFWGVGRIVDAYMEYGPPDGGLGGGGGGGFSDSRCHYVPGTGVVCSN